MLPPREGHRRRFSDGDKQWILVKMDDAEALRGSDVAAERPESVRTGRTL